jgi:hypothetical protein
LEDETRVEMDLAKTSVTAYTQQKSRVLILALRAEMTLNRDDYI